MTKHSNVLSAFQDTHCVKQNYLLIFLFQNFNYFICAYQFVPNENSINLQTWEDVCNLYENLIESPMAINGNLEVEICSADTCADIQQNGTAMVRLRLTKIHLFSDTRRRILRKVTNAFDSSPSFMLLNTFS